MSLSEYVKMKLDQEERNKAERISQLTALSSAQMMLPGRLPNNGPPVKAPRSRLWPANSWWPMQLANQPACTTERIE
jgi:hypothetical protein